MTMACPGVRAMPARRSSWRLTMGALARAWPVTKISAICMAKPSNVQKPPLQCCTMRGSDWSVESMPAISTARVSSAEKTKGEGR